MSHILVADDELDIGSTIQMILESEGYRVTLCANGLEALERARQDRPDLVLLDIMMPFLSGYEVLEGIRKTPELRGVPVILMSAITPDGSRRAALDWQAVLRKPFTLDQMLKTVAGILGGGGKRQVGVGAGG